MKKIIYCFIIVILFGCQQQDNVSKIQTTQIETKATECETFQTYQEYSNIFEGAIVECGKEERYYFEKVQVVYIDRQNNKILVTLRNPENKRCSAFVSYKELPQNIPEYVNITVGPVVRQTLPPILDGIE